MVEVLPWLFVSDQRSSERPCHLTARGIVRVVSVIDKYDHVHQREHLEHHVFHVSDMDTENILPVAEAVYELLRDQKRTLVHCFAGQSRCVSVVAYYLRRSGLAPSVSAAYAAIEAVHGNTSPNPAFVLQITNALDRVRSSVVGYGAAGSSSPDSSLDSESDSISESRCSHTRSSTLDSVGLKRTDQPSA